MSANSLKTALVLSLAFNAAVAGAVIYGFAHRPDPGEPRRPLPNADFARARCSRLCESVGVPADRVALFTHAMASSSQDMSETRARLFEARRELGELLRAAEPDERAIMAKVDEISGIQGELEKALVARLLRASSVLTPEERAKLMQIVGPEGFPRGGAGRRGPHAHGQGPGDIPQKEVRE